MQQRRILIVDDEAGLRELVRINLEHEGFAVLQAENGAQGVAIAHEQQPDLDRLVFRPGSSGYQPSYRVESWFYLRFQPAWLHRC
ncbi:MAG TPA: hypothetical protein PLI08_12455 [Bacteroidia bacterium]|nr:hypothetical protein [Bacteroidia bacterium]